MITVRTLFTLTIAAALLLDASFAQDGDHPSQQAVSRSSEKSTDQQKDEVRNHKDQARSKEPDEIQKQSTNGMRATARHPTSVSYSKRVPTHQARSVMKPQSNSPRIADAGSITPPDRLGSKADSKISKNVVSRHSQFVPSSAVSVNGQQFKGSHVPGARLVASGGPATTPRGTAAINGTDMRRKP
jgi:hypothetical protein